ncbi:MAG: hypothetical protein H0W72_13635 [Planctomycetes bacterium]|nr:hypothetical protein [Planctomycetota bacterium]
MYTLIKLLKSFFKIFNSAAAPWQVFFGTLFGVLLGFLPVMTSSGPALLGCVILLLAFFVNCHLGSVLMFFGISKLLSLVLTSPAVALGNACDSLAQTCAGIPFLHASRWSHTGWLGLTLIGLALAPILAIAMARVTVIFRTRIRDRLLERKRLVTAGKVGGNLILVRLTCWFFDL